MIRFCCTKCGREYLLADAFAHLPLLCKGCGDRLIVPDPGDSLPEPPPPPPSTPLPKPTFERSLGSSTSRLIEEPEPAHQVTEDSSEVDLFLSAELRKKLNTPAEMAEQPVPVPRPAAPPQPVAPEETERPDRTRLSWLIDGAAMLVMLAIGGYLGESVTRKSTVRILGDAPASAKFPPTDLLLWLGCVAAFGLVYFWLGTRGWTPGARLRRR